LNEIGNLNELIQNDIEKNEVRFLIYENIILIEIENHTLYMKQIENENDIFIKIE
jgi:hypothetical protein